MDRHSLSKIVTAIAVPLLFLSCNSHASIGQWLFDSNRNIEALFAGFEEKTLQINGEEWLYYVKSSTPLRGTGANDINHTSCTLLLHGFTAEASHWFRFARYIKQNDCVIAPDLPGFGRSTYATSSDYSIAAQVTRLHHFLTATQLTTAYHFVGSSMGGHIAASYSLTYPDEVASLTLINSGGVSVPLKSELDIKKEKTGKSVFEVDSIDEFKSLLDMTMSQPPWMPGIVRSHLGRIAISRKARHQNIFYQIYQQNMLNSQLNRINKPTLILWGSQDQLLHPSMANVFHTGIENSVLILMPNLGHLPFLEQPAKTAEAFNQFISKQHQ